MSSTEIYKSAHSLSLSHLNLLYFFPRFSIFVFLSLPYASIKHKLFGGDEMKTDFFIFIRRAIACDTQNRDCSVSIVTNTEQQTTKTDLCDFHHQNHSTEPTASNEHKLRFQLKKPLLKSIVLNKTSSVSIKQEPVDDYPEPNNFSNTETINECSTEHTNTDMQFTDNKKHKQIKSFFKLNDSDNVRSYSPPLPKSSRLASMVSNDSQRTVSGDTKPGRMSRERKSSKKKKRRRRSYSRSSRSRSR